MNINPLIRITLGLVSLTICLVIAGDFLLGLTGEQTEAIIKQRKKVVETLSMQFAPLAESGQIDTVQKAMKALVERNGDVESTALRSSDGAIKASAGDHSAHWQGAGTNADSLENAEVPLLVNGQRWGTVEVSFAPLRHTSIPFVPTDPLVRLLIFITAFGFMSYLFFMKRTLTHLDPKAVIPDKVKATLDLLAEGVVLVDTDDTMVLANLAFADKVGIDTGALIGKKLSDLGWRSPGSNETVEEFPWITAMKDGKAQTDFPLSLTTQSGQTFIFAANSSPILDHNFNLRGAMATFNDETELQEANGELLEMMEKLRKSQDKVNKQNEELKRLATRDPLTNCLNRRSFFEKIGKAFSIAASDGGKLSCIMLDIDHFKRINDKHGHAVGDKVIEMVAKLMESKFGSRDNICRYGGEEFCILLSGADQNKALELAQEARSTIESYATMGIETKESFTVTASLGVATLESGVKDATALIERADKALYQAKEQGRNRVERWTEGLAGNQAA